MHVTAQWRLLPGLGSNFGHSLLHIGKQNIFSCSVNGRSSAGSKLFELTPWSS